MSIRQEKIARAIQRDLAPLLSRYCYGILPGQLVTVVDVKATADLGLAKIYVSVLNAENREASLEVIRAHQKEIRHQLAHEIGKRIRKIPELHFYLDTTMDNAERINKIFDDLNQ